MTTVRGIMESQVVTVDPDMSAGALARLLSDRRISGVPVVDERGKAIGVVSRTDLVRLTASAGTRYTSLEHRFGDEAPWGAGALADDWWDDVPEEVTVRDIMTPVPFSVSPEDSVSALADFLVQGRIHRALVQERDILVGIVTSFDVMRWVAEGSVGS